VSPQQQAVVVQLPAADLAEQLQEVGHLQAEAPVAGK
jgi:hypothetical protein